MSEGRSSQDIHRTLDPHFPGYHFRPPANWLNDPNGLIEWRGVYHLFYQYNPSEPLHRNVHWGHATSRDLVGWTIQPVALAPTPGGADKDGCWSGCAFDDNGTPTIMYTGVHPEAQCLATGSDDLITWTKEPAPVIAEPPAGLAAAGFRDPFVWRENDEWRAVVGSGIRGQGGAILLYRSADARHWEYLGQLCEGNEAETGVMWECPNFFPLVGPEGKPSGKHALLMSPVPLHQAIYFIGTYDGRRFTPETRGVLDAGGCYYAPQTMLDSRGRRLVWGWLLEDRPGEASQAAGWAGVMSLPMMLSLDSAGRLAIAPVPELTALRGPEARLGEMEITEGILNLPDETGDCREIVAEIDPTGALAVGLVVRRSPDGQEETRVLYEPGTGRLIVDRSRASLDPATGRDAFSSELRLAPGEPLRLRVYIDRSVIAVSANDRLLHTARVYPTRADSIGCGLVALGGTARLRSLTGWEIADRSLLG